MKAAIIALIFITVVLTATNIVTLKGFREVRSAGHRAMLTNRSSIEKAGDMMRDLQVRSETSLSEIDDAYEVFRIEYYDFIREMETMRIERQGLANKISGTAHSELTAQTLKVDKEIIDSYQEFNSKVSAHLELTMGLIKKLAKTLGIEKKAGVMTSFSDLIE